jgi:outer membrane cobalamin receptor
MTKKDSIKLIAVTLCMTSIGIPPYSVAEEAMQEIIVTSERRGLPRFEHVGNAAVRDDERMSGTKHAHIHELLTRISGVWITRGSGQGCALATAR